MWDLPRPGLKPVSPALAGGFLTTVPPGKSWAVFLFPKYFLIFIAVVNGNLFSIFWGGLSLALRVLLIWGSLFYIPVTLLTL